MSWIVRRRKYHELQYMGEEESLRRYHDLVENVEKGSQRGEG